MDSVVTGVVDDGIGVVEEKKGVNAKIVHCTI